MIYILQHNSSAFVFHTFGQFRDIINDFSLNWLQADCSIASYKKRGLE